MGQPLPLLPITSALVEYMADKVAVMYQGKLVEYAGKKM